MSKSRHEYGFSRVGGKITSIGEHSSDAVEEVRRRFQKVPSHLLSRSGLVTIWVKVPDKKDTWFDISMHPIDDLVKGDRGRHHRY